MTDKVQRGDIIEITDRKTVYVVRVDNHEDGTQTVYGEDRPHERHSLKAEPDLANFPGWLRSWKITRAAPRWQEGDIVLFSKTDPRPRIRDANGDWYDASGERQADDASVDRCIAKGDDQAYVVVVRMGKLVGRP